MSEQEQQFAIARLYVKDLSFEAPSVPQIFQEDWKPELHLDINTDSSKLDEKGIYEVVLSLTVTVKSDKKTAFLVEVKQAGIFTIIGFNEEQLGQTLGSFCPSVLYPYARQVITDTVSQGGFPQLVLAPVNFDALYAEHLAQGGKKESAAG